jgi:hypothetical protein
MPELNANIPAIECLGQREPPEEPGGLARPVFSVCSVCGNVTS